MKNKNNKNLILIIILFFLISIISIYSANNYIGNNILIVKQIIFYLVGIIFIILINYLGNNFFIKYSIIFYIINILLLLGVLIFGNAINGSKAWFVIPFIGNLQPSEFMKIFLILILAKIINNENKNKFHSTNDEFKLIIKCLILTIIPSILTFLEPDTGAVIMYFIILIIMLFASGIKKRWFIIFFSIIVLLIGIILYLHFFQKNIFINLFGHNLFYRLDRLINWSTGSGMQLTNSLIGISSSNLFGNGFNTIPIYFPEPHTDFIFASFASCYGLIGSIILISIIVLFDMIIINIGIKSQNKENKYIITGIVGLLLYQQIQNIAMTMGLLPITGITLPFISYGGSSLLSYMIFMGFIINANKKIKHFA